MEDLFDKQDEVIVEQIEDGIHAAIEAAELRIRLLKDEEDSKEDLHRTEVIYGLLIQLKYMIS